MYHIVWWIKLHAVCSSLMCIIFPLRIWKIVNQSIKLAKIPNLLVFIFYHIRIQTVHLILLSTSTLGAPGTETSHRADHSRTPWGRTRVGRSLAETPLLWTLACVGTGSRTESEGAFVRGTGKSTGAASVTVAGWTTSSWLHPTLE